jgi:hypothetical protein
MLDMPHDTWALVPQHLLRLILPKCFWSCKFCAHWWSLVSDVQ